jgi:diaminohydroxyphosphoribosylaminopyrimidine deaminase/5-amino-6-(5-phosphoribosylamino)uracil reductase
MDDARMERSDSLDRGFMGRALELASRCEGSVSPRPPVGAVVVSARDEVVGEGWTALTPGPHAEIVALEAAGDRSAGSTLYTTLEPCAHTGATGPCTDAILRGGISRVVIGTRDPNPHVEGKGAEVLRRADVDVRVGILRARARALIEPFDKWIRTQVPFVTLKLASTLDGKVAAPDGTSRWITGPEARAEVHELRRRVDAVVVGSMTVVRDDPLLTYRGTADGAQPLRVVIDGSGRTPVGAQVLNRDARTLILTSEDLDQRFVEEWTAAGADVERVARGENGLDVRGAVELLGRRGLCHVLVEGGPTIASSFVERGLVDRFILYLAPKLIGGEAPGLLNEGVKTLTDAWPVRIDRVRRVGADLRIDASPEFG